MRMAGVRWVVWIFGVLCILSVSLLLGLLIRHDGDCWVYYCIGAKGARDCEILVFFGMGCLLNVVRCRAMTTVRGTTFGHGMEGSS